MSSDPNLWGPGAQLIPGPPGPMGPVGPAPELSVGNVTPGVAPAVSITPSGEGAYILNFVLQTGATGLRGLPGEAAKFSEVNVDTLPAGSPATATITGQGPEYVLNLGIPQGATGETGAEGSVSSTSICVPATTSTTCPSSPRSPLTKSKLST